jgi:mRNA-degrading endonuclease toxin of MazEF toxin-antitoxin module
MRFKPFLEGDVIIGPDPFHTNDPLLGQERLRPWLIISNPSFPRDGHEYIACALTSRRTPFDGHVDIQPGDWRRGGTRKPSKIDTTSVMTIKHAWITSYAGALGTAKLDEARRTLKSYL